ncbi:MAG TPA: ABC transporter ATP-binding protein [Burkholderiales bacterium]|nr:ABC transporter ATP-binding protein [Burkholderiales bacterium]
MSVAEPILRAVGLHKRFGGLVATNDVSFEVARAEFRAIIGPNGAGKSTLFNQLTGFLRPDAGRVLFEGRDVTAMAPYRVFRHGVSRTFQITNIFTNLTVLENVQIALLSHRRRLYRGLRAAGTQVVDEAKKLLALVGLVGDPAHAASTLSHGDRKKLELAVALANEPRLLFLDEPTAGMAANERLEAIRMVRRIADERELTVVFTEHDMQVVFAVADRISVLHHGSIIAEGKPEEVRRSEDVQRVYLGGVI